MARGQGISFMRQHPSGAALVRHNHVHSRPAARFAPHRMVFVLNGQVARIAAINRLWRHFAVAVFSSACGHPEFFRPRLGTDPLFRRGHGAGTINARRLSKDALRKGVYSRPMPNHASAPTLRNCFNPAHQTKRRYASTSLATGIQGSRTGRRKEGP